MSYTMLRHIDSTLGNQLLEEYLTLKIYKNFNLISKFTSIDNFPYAGYILNQNGPELIFSNFKDSNMTPDEREIFFRTLGIGNMVGTSMGHEYLEGIFELPARFPGYKCVAINIRINNVDAGDKRLRNYSLFQFNIFIPKKILKELPSLSTLEDEMIYLLKSRFYDIKDLEDKGEEIQKQVLSLMIKKLIS